MPNTAHRRMQEGRHLSCKECKIRLLPQQDIRFGPWANPDPRGPRNAKLPQMLQQEGKRPNKLNMVSLDALVHSLTHVRTHARTHANQRRDSIRNRTSQVLRRVVWVTLARLVTERQKHGQHVRSHGPKQKVQYVQSQGRARQNTLLSHAFRVWKI
jgi:hypothetical protein